MSKPETERPPPSPKARAALAGFIAGIIAGFISYLFLGVVGFVVGFIAGAIVGFQTVLLTNRAREEAQ